MPGLAVLEHALREPTGRGATTSAIRMSTFIRDRNKTRKQPMETGTGYYGHVAITAVGVRGRTPLEPALEIELKI